MSPQVIDCAVQSVLQLETTSFPVYVCYIAHQKPFVNKKLTSKRIFFDAKNSHKQSQKIVDTNQRLCYDLVCDTDVYRICYGELIIAIIIIDDYAVDNCFVKFCFLFSFINLEVCNV